MSEMTDRRFSIFTTFYVKQKMFLLPATNQALLGIVQNKDVFVLLWAPRDNLESLKHVFGRKLEYLGRTCKFQTENYISGQANHCL